MIKRGSLFHTSDGYGGSPPESDQAIVRFAMKTPNLSPEKNALLEQRLGVAAQARAKGIVIPRRTNQDPAPLSFAQRQMWVIDQMTPGNPAYNLPIGYRLKGSLDLTALENSFNEVIKRHEALRTTFAVQGGEPLQFIHSDFKIKITITDLSHLTGEQCHNALQALASGQLLDVEGLQALPVEPGQRRAVRLGDHIRRDDLALVVTSDRPVVVERDLYTGGGSGLAGSIAELG